MKKFLIILMVVAMASFLFVGCLFTTPNQPPVITTTALPDATVGTAYTATVKATDADGDALTFTLTGPTGMVISGAGIISGWTPTKAGIEAVTVAVTDGTDSVSAGFTITVSPVAPEPELQLIGIVVDPKKMTIIAGMDEEIESVTATYEFRGFGVDIPLGECTFLSNDEDVAIVSGSGTENVKIIAEEKGKATIIVSYGGKVDTIAVTVIAVELDYISVNPKTMDLIVGGDEEVLSKTIGSVVAYYNNEDVVGVDLVDCNYLYNEEVVTVDDNGLVTVAGGLTIPVTLASIVIETTITVSYEGKTDTIEVTVTVLSNDVTLSSLTYTVDGEVVELTTGDTEYEVELDALPTTLEVDAVATHPEADVEDITQPTLPLTVDDPTTVTVVVTAEDDITTGTYTVR